MASRGGRVGSNQKYYSLPGCLARSSLNSSIVVSKIRRLASRHDRDNDVPAVELLERRGGRHDGMREPGHGFLVQIAGVRPASLLREYPTPDTLVYP